MISDIPAFIRENTRVFAPSHVPEIKLYLADDAVALWEMTEEQLGEMGLPPPFWAFAWAGGQALARYQLDHAEIVRNLKPDIAALAKVDMGASGGAIVTAPGDNDVDYVCRFFAPSEGIDEDAATGSIHCTLVPYWAGRTGKQTFRVQQLSSRGARMLCTLVGDRVKIIGDAKLYLQGTINI